MGCAENRLIAAGEFSVGCNYWASHAGMLMWRDWRPEVVEEDLRQLGKAGLEVLRVFPLWPDFQPLTRTLSGGGGTLDLRFGEEPLPDTPAGQAGVDETMLERFQFLADCAQRNGLKLLIGLITGWMSGRLFVPPAFSGRNVLRDPEVLRWQVRLVRCFVRRFRGHPALIGWDLGNECNCMASVTRDEAWCWTNTVTSAIRLEDAQLPVVSGMHSLVPDEPHGSWRIQDQGELTDLLTTHPYPLFTPYCNQEPVNRIRNALHATAESRFYADISGKPCLAEEVGTLGPCIASEEVTAAYARMALFSLWAHDCHGLLWWCAYDQNELNNSPYDWNAIERELGLFRADYGEKPVAREMAKFRSFLAALPFDRLPNLRPDAVCILTRGQDSWAAAFSAFILARQTGFNLVFRYADQVIPEAKLYLLPAVSGCNHSSRALWRILAERVAAGASVYVSHNDGIFSPFQDFFGTKVRAREIQTSGENYAMDGYTVHGQAPFRLVLENCGAETLGTDSSGSAAFTRFAMGKGKVYFLTFPLELNMARTPGAFESNPGWRIYAEIARDILQTKIVRSADPLVGVTEHFINESEAIVVLVNYAQEAKPLSVQFSDVWTMAQNFSGDGGATDMIPGNDAVVLKIVRRG